ncbi:MAG: hypothetical protein QM660_13180 [Dysgonomonas sp.]
MFTQFSSNIQQGESKAMLENILAKFGFIPNQDKVLAAAPTTYKAYNQAFDLFLGKSSLGLLNGQIVIMTTSYENNSPYCMALHTWGMEMTKVPKDIIDSLRDGIPIKDSKLEILRTVTCELINNKGNISKDTLNAFFKAGYTEQNLIDVIGGIATKTIANYANIVAKTPLDETMKVYKWIHPSQR